MMEQEMMRDNVSEIKDALKHYMDLFNCLNCRKILTNPCQASCGHIFCSNCIKSIERTEKSKAKCPNCRKKWNIQATRPRNDLTGDGKLNLAFTYVECKVMEALEKESTSNKNESEGNDQEETSSVETNFDEEEEEPSSSGYKETQYWSGAAKLLHMDDDEEENKENDNKAELSGEMGEVEVLRKTTPTTDDDDSHQIQVEATISVSPLEVRQIDCGSSGSGNTRNDKEEVEFRENKSQMQNGQDFHEVIDDQSFQNNDEGIEDMCAILSTNEPLPQADTVCSDQPALLSQSQALDLSMLPVTFLEDVDNDTINRWKPKSAIKFNKPLDLSAKKRGRESSPDQHRELINQVCQQPPENSRRRHPIFLLHEGRGDVTRKRQKVDLNFERFTAYPVIGTACYDDPRKVHTRDYNDSGKMNNNLDQSIEPITIESNHLVQPQPDQPISSEEVFVVQRPPMDGNTNDNSGVEDQEDQVFPSTPEKEVIPDSPEKEVIPDSPEKNLPDSCFNDDPGGRNEEIFNSRSTFASPLPSQCFFSVPLESQKSQSQPRRKFIFCPSRLNRVELAKLSGLCSVCDGTISKDYTDEVTHLVIKLEKGRVPHTMKYLFAIADKKWIVVYDWILECKMQGEMVPEDPYESSSFPDCDPGVRKSRLSPDKLYTNVCFYFPTPLKSSGASIDDCKKLVEKMGGTVISNPFEVGDETGLIIVAEGIQKLYKSKGCIAVAWTWILDCLLAYSVLPVHKTHLLTKLDNSRPVNFPEPLIAVNRSSPLFNRPTSSSTPCRE